MRADRLLCLLLLLQNRGRLTAPELAAELEVSVRTVYRDIEALGAAGVPVVADRGPAGGYRLLAGYRTRLTGLTGDEAVALFLAGLPVAAAELGLGSQLTTAQLKLRAALPEPLGEQTRRMQDRFHLDAPAWFRQADPVPDLLTVADAVWRQRVLRVRYRRARGDTVERDLHPLGLVLKGGIWYVVAHPAGLGGAGGGTGPADGGTNPGGEATGRESGPPVPVPESGREPVPESEPDGRGSAAAGPVVRTYRVSRISAAEALPVTFRRPEGFDLAGYWAASSRALEEARFRGEAELLLSARGLRLLPAKYGAAGARAAAAAGEPGPDGRFRVTLPVESLPVAVDDMLRLGTDAEVVGPPELRRAVARAVTELAQRYAADAPGNPSA
ncbi:WYL domain-containing protein [Streptomyces pactum]|uniref:WYL domain-containing protein n=1 Tax=Streptomyces pactum TaxID=68249 RepID=A0ABS0NEV2_9ACTN|nr:WYL domain-containing protein [Streptomyces pactum]MBH5333726.1 WYL domain-containing protein [Streptomyces pactum]